MIRGFPFSKGLVGEENSKFLSKRLNNKGTTAKLIFAAIYILFWPALVLFISGDWLWLEGWIFGVWFVLMSVIITIYLYLKDAELLAERFRMQGTGNQKKWDKYFMLLIGVMVFSLDDHHAIRCKEIEMVDSFSDAA